MKITYLLDIDGLVFNFNKLIKSQFQRIENILGETSDDDVFYRYKRMFVK